MQKVLGIGNALVDILVRTEDEALLEKYSLPKGTMQLVDSKKAEQLVHELEKMDIYREAGGSAANTINGLAKLGVDTGFIGTLGDDEPGEFFKLRMLKNGVKPRLLKGKAHTGKAITLVTQDSERTFATYLGAAAELAAKALSPTLFEGFNYLHVEGYLVQNHDLLETALKMAKGKRQKISMDLASFNIVEENRGFLSRMIHRYVDIVFANEEEARALTLEDPKDALGEIAEMTDIAIVKTGAEGSLIQRGDQTYRISSFRTEVVDTTGAGDLYAAGFLYGLIRKMSLDRCGQIGSFMASKVIEEMGAHIHEDRWPKIDKMLEAVIS